MKLIDILNEYEVKKPSKKWVLNSDDYKSFYQLVKLCEYWGVELTDVDNYDFNNEYDFFTAIFNRIEDKNLKPDYGVFTEGGLYELAADFNLNFIEDPSNPDGWKIDYKDPTIKQIVAQLNKHAGRK